MNAKYHLSVGYNTFKRLLSNTMLYGAYRDNPNYCEGYIDKATFDRIQEIGERNCKTNPALRAYIFSGLIKCPDCGRTLASMFKKSKNRYGSIYHYKQYRCPKRQMSNTCSFGKVINEKTFEKMLLQNIRGLVEDAKIRSIKVTDAAEPKVPKYDIEEINKEIERLNYSWQKGRIKTIEQYDKQYDELMERLDLAQAEQEETATQDFEKIEDILHQGWEEIYKALDDEHRRAFWRSFISSIEIEWTTETKRITKVNFF